MSEHSMPSIEALRDFFAATDAHGLHDAAVRIAGSSGHEIPSQTDWSAVEYEFNRLFVGPAAIPAPPFASAWSESDRALMGRATSEARQTYHRLGLAVPEEGVIPDDHLAFELEAVLAMKSILAAGGGAPETDTHDAEIADLHAWFVGEHLARWLPPFVQAVRDHGSENGVVAMATEALAAWFETERTTTAAPRRA
jgi:TorA maturation chaperone TorD